MAHASPFSTSTLRQLSNDIKNALGVVNPYLINNMEALLEESQGIRVEEFIM